MRASQGTGILSGGDEDDAFDSTSGHKIMNTRLHLLARAGKGLVHLGKRHELIA